MKLDTTAPAAQVSDVAERPAVLILRDPYTGERLSDKEGAVTITLIGAQSRSGRENRRRAYNRRMRNVADQHVDAADEAERDSAQMLASLTRGWTNVGDATGPIPFSYDAAVKVYTDLPWIRMQVDAFVSNLANFGEGLLGNSPSSSSPTPTTTSDSASAPATGG